MSVISDKFMGIGEKELSNATFKYIKEKDDNGEPIPHLKSDTSYPYFDCFVQSKEKTQAIEVATEEENNIRETYEYFNSLLSEANIKKYSNKFKNLSYKDILIYIRDQILQSSLVAIVTPAYMIFEILNAKGKNLASIELIKNIIFEQMHNDENGATGKAEKLWEDIKKELHSISNPIGFATFYRHYWISKYSKVTNSRLYDSFKEYIKEGKKEYMNFLEELKRESVIYKKYQIHLLIVIIIGKNING